MIFENGTWILIGMALMIIWFLYGIRDFNNFQYGDKISSPKTSEAKK